MIRTVAICSLLALNLLALVGGLAAHLTRPTDPTIIVCSMPPHIMIGHADTVDGIPDEEVVEHLQAGEVPCVRGREVEWRSFDEAKKGTEL